MEIGSEFHCVIEDHKSNLEYFKEEYLFGFTRGALYSVVEQLKEKGNTKFLIPNYLCESVLATFLQHHLEIQYYKINHDLSVNMEDFSCKYNKESSQVIFITNYFNVDNELLLHSQFDLANVISIVDVTHNIFSTKMSKSDIYVASLRKWIGIPSGTYVKLNNTAIVNLRTEMTESSIINEIIYKRAYAANLKTIFLSNNREELKANFLEIFNAAEKQLDENGTIHTPIDRLSSQLLQCTDWNKVFEQRKKNFLYLEENLRDVKEIITGQELLKDQVPFGFPVFTSKRDELRKYLIENQIYCPIHWPIPEIMKGKDNIIETIGSTILTLPCDQRYDIEDMKRLVSIIKKFLGVQ